MNKYEYVLFDVAGTLLYKPTLFNTILNVLKNNGYAVPIQELKAKHKLLSEVIHFPDRTDGNFYSSFNSELLFSLGILPTDKILGEIFEKCSYLHWDKYEDTKIIEKLDLNVGIVSNFNTSLQSKLNTFFGPIFKHVIVSEELGIAKPKAEFYEKALYQIGVKPNKVLYVGDSMKLDIMPAVNMGITSILIDRENFYASSKYRITSLNDILQFIN